MRTDEPVNHFAAGETRKVISSAISSGSPSREMPTSSRKLFPGLFHRHAVGSRPLLDEGPPPSCHYRVRYHTIDLYTVPQRQNDPIPAAAISPCAMNEHHGGVFRKKIHDYLSVLSVLADEYSQSSFENEQIACHSLLSPLVTSHQGSYAEKGRLDICPKFRNSQIFVLPSSLAKLEIGILYYSLLVPINEALMNRTRRSDKGTRFRTLC
jgi:hypothetical protein